MKILKKIILVITAVLMSFCTNFSSFISVNAEENKETYTIQEYEKIISAEAEKYDIAIEILDSDDSITITDETISRGIESLKNFYFSQRKIEIDSVSPAIRRPSAELMTMPANRTRRAGYYVYNVYGSCTIYTEINALVDLQNGAVMTINSATSYQSGEFVNFSGWTQTSNSTTTNSPRVGYVKTIVSGRATFQYADPFTGITTGYTSTERFTVNVFMS